MTAYEDGKGGWLFRESTTEALAQAVLASDWLADRLAAAWDEGDDHGYANGNHREPHRGNPYRAALRKMADTASEHQEAQ